MALAAIVGMAVTGTWLWIPHRDALAWEYAQKVRPLLWVAFFAAMIAGISATRFLTVTAFRHRRSKRKNKISHH